MGRRAAGDRHPAVRSGPTIRAANPASAHLDKIVCRTTPARADLIADYVELIAASRPKTWPNLSGGGRSARPGESSDTESRHGQEGHPGRDPGRNPGLQLGIRLAYGAATRRDGRPLLPDEAAVDGPIRSTVKEPGFYCSRGWTCPGRASSPSRGRAEKAKQGPVGVLIVHPQGREFVRARCCYGAGNDIVSASWRPCCCPGPGRGRLLDARGMVTVLGLLAFVTIVVPDLEPVLFPGAFVAPRPSSISPAGS